MSVNDDIKAEEKKLADLRKKRAELEQKRDEGSRAESELGDSGSGFF